MGYERPILNLVFADPEMEGLEVRAQRLSIAAVFRVTELSELPVKDLRGGKLDELLALLADALVSWNLEERRRDLEDCPIMPVPLTGEALNRQDIPFVTAIAGALADASAAVPRPLEPTSSDGQQSLEVSLPMELLPSPSS